MTKDKYWLYLEKLRRSGKTNMYGAAPYLAEHFMLTLEEADHILRNWMRNYNPDDYKPETLRVCYKRPGEFAQVREINNSLGALQHLVGGLIEMAGLWSRDVGILVNEEGLLLNLHTNCMGLFGPMVWVGLTKDDFRSLTDAEVEGIMDKWG